MQAAFAEEWTRPRSYDAQRVQRPIEIDGDIYKQEWAEVPWSEDFVDIQGEDAPPGNDPTEKTRTRMKMRWDNNFLYVAAEMGAKDWPIIAEYTERNEVIYDRDSDFEVFLDSEESNQNYKELELNAKNTVWNLMLDKAYADGGAEHSARVAKPGEPKYWEVKGQKTAARVFGDLGKPNPDGKWTAEVALSHADSLDRTTDGKMPAVGGFWRINFSRVEKKGKLNWVWSPQMVWSPAEGRYVGTVGMHYPDVWGYVHFVEAAAAPVASNAAKAAAWSDPAWPLKAATSQLFYAETHAESPAGGKQPLSLQALEKKGWVRPQVFKELSTKVENTGDSAKPWAAVLERDRAKSSNSPCTATIQRDHRLSVRCGEAGGSLPMGFIGIALLVAVLAGAVYMCLLRKKEHPYRPLD